MLAAMLVTVEQLAQIMFETTFSVISVMASTASLLCAHGLNPGLRARTATSSSKGQVSVSNVAHKASRVNVPTCQGNEHIVVAGCP